MERTASQTAILVVLLLKRAEVKRARISQKTVRLISKRTHLRRAFLNRLNDELDDLGVHMVELERGGYGMIFTSALDGANVVLAKNHILDELRQLKRLHGLEREEFFETLRNELGAPDDTDEGDDE